MRPAALFTLLVLAGACAAPSDIPDEPTIELDREPVVLPAAWVGTKQQQSLQVLNRGANPLTVTKVQLLSPDGGTLPADSAFGAAEFSAPLPAKVDGLGSGFVRFEFAPKSAATHEAKLVIESDAPARPRLETKVTGCAAALDGGC